MQSSGIESSYFIDYYNIFRTLAYAKRLDIMSLLRFVRCIKMLLEGRFKALCTVNRCFRSFRVAFREIITKRSNRTIFLSNCTIR